MADLLTDADRAEIRAALKDVADTFFKDTVLYYKAGESLDRFNEDRADQVDTELSLAAMVEYEQAPRMYGNLVVKGGGESRETVKVTCFFTDLPAELKNSTELLCQDEKDYMIVKNQRYKVILAILDGPLTDLNVLAIIYGILEERNAV